MKTSNRKPTNYQLPWPGEAKQTNFYFIFIFPLQINNDSKNETVTVRNVLFVDPGFVIQVKPQTLQKRNWQFVVFIPVSAFRIFWVTVKKKRISDLKYDQNAQNKPE